MEKSDLNIALKGKNFDIEQLRDEVALIDTLITVDLVALDHCTNELLKQEVEKDGITLYRKV